MPQLTQTEIIELKKWINSKYLDTYVCGKIEGIIQTKPFVHAALPDFFTPQAIAGIEATCNQTQVEQAHNKGLAQSVDWYWGAFSNIEFLKFYYGGLFRRFLNEISGTRVIAKPKSYPQFNIFKSNSKGIPIHNDFCEKVGLVTILQMSEGYEPGRGGELCFYTKSGDSYSPLEVVKPIKNTFIIFKVSENSYHGVNDMIGDWHRRTITIDWLTEDMKNVASA